MPESRLNRTRAVYEPQDPTNRLARIYLQHASGLLRDGQISAARAAIDEAAMILEPRARLVP